MLQQQQELSLEPTITFGPVNGSIATTLPAIATTVISEVQPEELPKNDFSQLIDLEDFDFITNHEGCRALKHKPMIIILVHSAPDNFAKRTVIRETWGSKDPRSLLKFLIGAVNTSNLQDKIELENKVNEDIVQGNFEDAYRNMTYKHVAALKWFIYNCPDAQFLLKTDDDVFVNTPLMYDYLENPSDLSQQFHRGRLLFCNEIPGPKVKRTFRSKWRVSYEEYFDRFFPNHCPGFAILYSADVALQIYQKAQKLPYFWIDDVHITGTVASKLNISIAATNGFFLTEHQQTMLLEGDARLKSFPLFFFAQPNLPEDEIRLLWGLVKNNREPALNEIN